MPPLPSSCVLAGCPLPRDPEGCQQQTRRVSAVLPEPFYWHKPGLRNLPAEVIRLWTAIDVIQTDIVKKVLECLFLAEPYR